MSFTLSIVLGLGLMGSAPKGGYCHDHSQSVPVVPLENTSIPVRIHSTGLVHNRTRSTSPLRISALRTGYACH